MAKGKTRRAKVKERAGVEPLVNPFAAAHGDFRNEPMAVTAGELGSSRAGNVQVLRNRAGTTVERWIASDTVTPDQREAIDLYIRAWNTHIGQQRVVANWSLAPGPTSNGSAAGWADSHAQAKRTLDVIDDRVFKIMPQRYIDTWKNVVIFDEAAGTVGARLGFKSKGAEASAKMVVLFIADIIASNVMRSPALRA